MIFRLVNILTGTWLAVSAFGWPHRPLQMIDAIACGLLAVILGVTRFYRPDAQYGSAVLAVWIFAFAVMTMPFGETTLWNNAVCAAVLFVSALAGDKQRHFIGFRRPSVPAALRH